MTKRPALNGRNHFGPRAKQLRTRGTKLRFTSDLEDETERALTSDLEDETEIHFGPRGRNRSPLRTSRTKLELTSDLEDETTTDLEDESGMPRTKVESPRTKVRITSDLEDETGRTKPAGRNHLGPGKKSLRTWEPTSDFGPRGRNWPGIRTSDHRALVTWR
eukprot:gene10473-biopygen4356